MKPILINQERTCETIHECGIPIVSYRASKLRDKRLFVDPGFQSYDITADFDFAVVLMNLVQGSRLAKDRSGEQKNERRCGDNETHRRLRSMGN